MISMDGDGKIVTTPSKQLPQKLASGSSVTGNMCVYVCDHCKISGNNIVVHGHYNVVVGASCLVFGHHNNVRGAGMQVVGDNNRVYGPNCTCKGKRNEVIGTDSTCKIRTVVLPEKPICEPSDDTAPGTSVITVEPSDKKRKIVECVADGCNIGMVIGKLSHLKSGTYVSRNCGIGQIFE